MSTATLVTSPRKSPRQARAVATVEAILTAAAQVLVEWGYEKATTARVAERAGVSIGSLYQYFPNKESLVASLIERHADEIVETISRALAERRTLPIEQGLRGLIQASIDVHRISPALHKILHEQVPRIGRMGKAMDTSRKITQAIEKYLWEHTHEMQLGRDPASAAVIVETVIEALGHRAVIDRRELLSTAAAVNEIYDLVSGYLLKKAPTLSSDTAVQRTASTQCAKRGSDLT